MSSIVHARDARGRLGLGGKARALARLEGQAFPVPAWFVVTVDAFHESLTERQRQLLQEANTPHAIENELEAIRPNLQLQKGIALALKELDSSGGRFAVRSSASDEDGATHSFAGQLDSYLFVAASDVCEKVAAVWRSAFSERAFAYRREHKLDRPFEAPAVLVQRMVDSDAAGVAFGVDPVTGRWGVAIVAAVFGLGTALVSGECDADTYQVDRQGQIVRREIAHKKIAHRFGGGGEGVLPVTVAVEDATRPVLTEAQVAEVAALVRRSGRHFQRPQDIEWAYEKGHLYLLQSRPITSLASVRDPDGALSIWDNSNIAESYSGVTTPLTFSFARAIYEGVYRQFCRLMRVPESVIASNDRVFAQMLGLVRGRVYYNLLNWYRVLAMFPGFALNRRFMEQMMGVREGIPDECLANAGKSAFGERLRDTVRFGGTVAGLVWNHFILDRKIREFGGRLNRALSPPNPPLDEMRADELALHYLQLESQLLTRWDAPLVNDFFAMIFHGLLGALAERWCEESGEVLASDLVRGQSAMISAEPAQRVRKMADLIADDEAFAALLSEGTPDVAHDAARSHAKFQRQFEEYIAKFGDRCLEELKLESPTLHDNPLPLLRSVGNLARNHKSTPESSLPNDRLESFRASQDKVHKTLRWHPVRRIIFGWVLRNARARVLERENLRFERTRLFGRVRRIFVEIGRRFYSLDLLDDARDIFYLEVEEVLGFIQGTTSTVDLKNLVSVRKHEFEGYENDEPPADRFETRGIVYQGNPFRAVRKDEEFAGDERRGIGCCSGVARGPVRVVTNPRQAELPKGSILVAERTDPGWILLFPAATGLLVERGSLLSHSAIVAREMGIPAVVSIPGVTRWLKDGDWVELDGAAGVVRRISEKGNRPE